VEEYRERRRWPCGQCGRKFTRKDALKRHIERGTCNGGTCNQEILAEFQTMVLPGCSEWGPELLEKLGFKASGRKGKAKE